MRLFLLFLVAIFVSSDISHKNFFEVCFGQYMKIDHHSKNIKTIPAIDAIYGICQPADEQKGISILVEGCSKFQTESCCFLRSYMKNKVDEYCLQDLNNRVPSDFSCTSAEEMIFENLLYVDIKCPPTSGTCEDGNFRACVDSMKRLPLHQCCNMIKKAAQKAKRYLVACLISVVTDVRSMDSLSLPESGYPRTAPRCRELPAPTSRRPGAVLLEVLPQRLQSRHIQPGQVRLPRLRHLKAQHLAQIRHRRA